MQIAAELLIAVSQGLCKSRGARDGALKERASAKLVSAFGGREIVLFEGGRITA